MSDSTLNGLAVIRGDHKQPHAGAWVAEVELDADSRPLGAAELVLLGRTWRGKIVADPSDAAFALSGDSGGWYRCRVVGGAGGLQNAVTPEEWSQGALVQTVLSYILGAGGEVQAATISTDLLGKVLPQWSITAMTVGEALSAFAEALGVIWRVLDDGTIWLGTPNPQPVPAPDYILTDINPEMGAAEMDLNDASIAVDQILDGLTVRQVIYTWTPDKMRALVTYAPGPVNLLFRLFGMWLARVKLDNFRAIPGRINSQNGDYTVQFQPDDSRYSPMRRTNIRVGLPDTEVTIGANSRGLATWEGASPTSPVLAGFGVSTATSIKLAASSSPKQAARKGDAAGYLLCVVANVSGVPVVTQVNWSPTQPVPPFVTPIVPAVPGSYYQKITITEGSSVVEVGG